MCGVVAIWQRQSGDLRSDVAAVAMSTAIATRGPDGEGVWLDPDGGLALAHRRLSVIDLSEAGKQPMVSPSGALVIAFNGEIYNFGELRSDLERDGAISSWRGHSDTEVLLAAVEIWGVEEALHRAEGMFAFAVWDRRDRSLILARDRMGEKPLYYGWSGSSFLVGSELKALQAFPGWQGQVDASALQLYMRYGYVPTPFSIYLGVRKLPPGTFVRIQDDCAIGELPRPRPYWSAVDTALQAVKFSTGDPAGVIHELDQHLSSAVRRQMVADVPLGAFLSGGVDSSLVVAHMQRLSSRPVQTFSIGFREHGYDEAQYAAAVARHLGTSHTELYVTPAETRDVIPLLPTIYDEPFADSSQIPTYLVTRLARGEVTAALSGDGGDELFGGYTRYVLGARLARWIETAPLILRKGLARCLTAISPANWDAAYRLVAPVIPQSLAMTMPGHKLHKLASVIDALSPDEAYRRLLSQWPDPEWLLASASAEAPTWADLEAGRAGGIDFVESMMLHDQLAYMADDILVKVDRAAMGVSLETRVPLLDRQLVEFAWRVPVALKIREGRGKWLLRQALYRHVPRDLIERPKQGFAVPLESWLRGPLREWAEHLLDRRRLREDGYFHPEHVWQRWNEHLSGTRNWQYGLWPILMFQAWQERWK
jgi:asparagine synthase (glutamine-hydrolysing)